MTDVERKTRAFDWIANNLPDLNRENFRGAIGWEYTVDFRLKDGRWHCATGKTFIEAAESAMEADAAQIHAENTASNLRTEVVE